MAIVHADECECARGRIRKYRDAMLSMGFYVVLAYHQCYRNKFTPQTTPLCAPVLLERSLVTDIKRIADTSPVTLAPFFSRLLSVSFDTFNVKLAIRRSCNV